MSDEEALRESEERFRLTIDEAPIGMALVSLDGRFLRVNRAFCAVVGYEPAELTNLTFQDITHPEDLDTDLALTEQLLRGEIPRCRFEKRYIRKDGTVVDIMLSLSILRDPGGAPLYYISQIEDITERKRIEEELRAANAFLDAIIENIPLMLFIKESQSLRFIRFNRAGEDLLGWPKQTLIGKNDYDFWPKEQAEFFVEKDRETLKRGSVVDNRKNRYKRAIKAFASCIRKKFRSSIRPATRFIFSVSRRTSQSESGSKRNSSSWLKSASRCLLRSNTSRRWRTWLGWSFRMSPTGVPLT